jgi:hypothetical protein
MAFGSLFLNFLEESLLLTSPVPSTVPSAHIKRCKFSEVFFERLCSLVK